MFPTGSTPELSWAEWPVSSSDLHDTMFPVWGLWMCTSAHSFVVVVHMRVLGKDAGIASALLIDQSLPSPQKSLFLFKVLTTF